jgi:hypothetical protein
MQRRLEDQIRQLCARIVVTDNEKLGPILEELRDVLRKYGERPVHPADCERRKSLTLATRPERSERKSPHSEYQR